MMATGTEFPSVKQAASYRDTPSDGSEFPAQHVLPKLGTFLSAGTSVPMVGCEALVLACRRSYHSSTLRKERPSVFMSNRDVDRNLQFLLQSGGTGAWAGFRLRFGFFRKDASTGAFAAADLRISFVPIVGIGADRIHLQWMKSTGRASRQ